MSRWYSRGYVPHIDSADLIQHITFHLADSLPRDAVDRMHRDLETLPEDQRTMQRRRRIQDLLDAGAGSCVLGRDDCARIVQDALLFGDGLRYRLLAWVVMPNHVHVMIQPTGWSLGTIVQAWKRHTAREINRLLGSMTVAGPSLWQRHYWDRYIRDAGHYATATRYIEQNPVTAGLVKDPADWRWSHRGWAKHLDEPAE